MLFNSYEFLFCLLPIAWLGNRYLCEMPRAQSAWLLLCSLFFYGWWNPIYLPLLGSSILFNFAMGNRLRVHRSRGLLTLGIVANVALLGYFKYSHFLGTNLENLTGIDLGTQELALPLAISFITFQKIAYLVDCFQGGVRRYSLLEFSLFASFFPQLIAGPIVHHGELIPQLNPQSKKFELNVSVGMTIFIVGLFKKTVIADNLAPYASALFDDPLAWNSVTLIHAWTGVLAYGFQLYFDFSGYSDMAIGAARLFGVKLPQNFFSPYRATSITDFWRRWHMTLSQFLRDYVYIPLGGNRHGEWTRVRNLLLTMFIGGLWHGAGWTFIWWGILHGVLLSAHHAWARYTQSWKELRSYLVYRAVACLTTFVVVQFGWVLFRAPSMDCASHIVGGMLGQNGVSLPVALVARASSMSGSLGIVGDATGGAAFIQVVMWILVAACIVWLLPTTQQFLSDYEPSYQYSSSQEQSLVKSGFGLQLATRWQPRTACALLMAVLAMAGVLSLPEVSEFLYFQF